MRFFKKALLAALGMGVVIVGLTMTAVACTNGQVPRPYNSNETKFTNYGSVAATGYFADHTGMFLQNVNQSTLVSQLRSNYIGIGITNPNALVSKIIYQPGKQQDDFNNGTLTIWLSNYQIPMNPNGVNSVPINNGIVVTITGIYSTIEPLVAAPSGSAQNQVITTSQLAVGSTLADYKNYSAQQWSLSLKAIGILPWNFLVQSIDTTTSQIVLKTSGQCLNNVEGFITVTVVNPPTDQKISVVNETRTVQTVFGQAETLNQVYEMTQLDLFISVNKAFFQDHLAQNLAMTNGNLNQFQITTIYSQNDDIAQIMVEFLYNQTTNYVLTITGFNSDEVV